MDNGLSQAEADFILSLSSVLILIVMDNGLSPLEKKAKAAKKGLNPYCNG